MGLLFAPALIAKPYVFWHGIAFINYVTFKNDDDQNKKVGTMMAAVCSSVIRKAGDQIGSRKLGQVFKSFASDPDLKGYLQLLNFACLVRSKPKDWLISASDIIAKTDRKAFYLGAMLNIAIKQFRDEINTGGEREDIKRLIATVRIKREFKKNYPGITTVDQAIGQLEKQDYFEALQKPTNAASE